MKCTRVTKNFIYFFFHCEACEEEGHLKIPTDIKKFTCPSCGALYILWFNPLTNKQDLKCVVAPIFRK